MEKNSYDATAERTKFSYIIQVTTFRPYHMFNDSKIDLHKSRDANESHGTTMDPDGSKAATLDSSHVDFDQTVLFQPRII